MEDGIKCGSGKMCYDQRCVSVSSLGFPQCPTGSNGQVCSGNGVINPQRPCTTKVAFHICISQHLQVCINEGNCSCSIDFTGETCERMYFAIVLCMTIKHFRSDSESNV